MPFLLLLGSRIEFMPFLLLLVLRLMFITFFLSFSHPFFLQYQQRYSFSVESGFLHSVLPQFLDVLPLALDVVLADIVVAGIC
jgi:hypothetical protein